MKRKARNIFWFIVIVLIVGAGAYAYNKQTHQITATNVPVVENNKDLDSIRNREDIKKQQELIVQEAYFLQQKDKVSAEKAAAVQSYDDKLTNIEKQLEDVRSQKLSFQ